MNSLFGKFGMHRYKTIIDNVDLENPKDSILFDEGFGALAKGFNFEDITDLKVFMINLQSLTRLLEKI